MDRREFLGGAVASMVSLRVIRFSGAVAEAQTVTNWAASIVIDDTVTPWSFTGVLEEGGPDPSTDPVPVADWIIDLTLTETTPGEFVQSGTITAPDSTVYDISGTATDPDVAVPTSWPFVNDIDVVLTGDVVLDTNARVNSLDLNGHKLIFDPSASRLLQSRGNIVNTAAGSEIVIDGTAHPEHDYVIEFIDVDETAFAGSGMEILDTDVGLWSGHHGVETIHGAPKTERTRAAADIPAGAQTFDVADAAGWRVGDSLVIAPHRPVTSDDFTHVMKGPWLAYDERTITDIDGNTITVDSPLDHDHPTFTDRHGTVYGCPILNLTRNVKIRGTETGRAHTMYLHSMAPINVSHVEYSHLGPVKYAGSDAFTHHTGEAVLGRWGQHLHHGGEHVRGSVFEGLVAHNIGTNAFVPHKVSGVTYRRCISHATGLTGFWWDTRRATADGHADRSNDITYDECVASLCRRYTYAGTGERLINRTPVGFEATAGAGNIMRRCWSFGHERKQGRGGGYIWNDGSGVPEGGNTPTPNTLGWVFEDCIAHNTTTGWDNWLNHGSPAMDGFLIYHCKGALLDGAYINTFTFRDFDIYGTTRIQSEASKRASTDPHFHRIYIDVDGLSDYGLRAGHHNLPAQAETVVADCELAGFNVAAFGFSGASKNPHLYRIVNPTIPAGGRLVWFEDDPANPQVAGSVVTVVRDGQPTIELRPDTYTGDTSGMTWSADWNCWVATL